MNILLLEPYNTGSHAQWAAGYQTHSRHQVDLLALAGANWKWRMHGGAVTLASDSGLELIPYYLYSNRGKGWMRVWLPRN